MIELARVLQQIEKADDSGHESEDIDPGKDKPRIDMLQHQAEHVSNDEDSDGEAATDGRRRKGV